MKSCFANLNRIEFVMTLACTGRCKHCSEGDHDNCTDHPDGDTGAALVHQLCKDYQIESLMSFGGEPLLYPEDVCKIHRAATEQRIPKRHIITNILTLTGYIPTPMRTTHRISAPSALLRTATCWAEIFTHRALQRPYRNTQPDFEPITEIVQENNNAIT